MGFSEGNLQTTGVVCSRGGVKWCTEVSLTNTESAWLQWLSQNVVQQHNTLMVPSFLGLFSLVCVSNIIPSGKNEKTLEKNLILISCSSVNFQSKFCLLESSYLFTNHKQFCPRYL